MTSLFRISPIAAGSIRTLVKDLVLSGYRVPEGVCIIYMNFHIYINKLCGLRIYKS